MRILPFAILVFSLIFSHQCIINSAVKDCLSDGDCDPGKLCQDSRCKVVDAGLPDGGGEVDANECADGEARCLSETSYQVCSLDGSTWKWGAAQACGQRQTCVDGTCQCQAGCQSGEGQCTADLKGLKTCATDGDGCNYLPDAVPCVTPDQYGQEIVCYQETDAGVATAACCQNSCKDGTFQCEPGASSTTENYQLCGKDSHNCYTLATTECGSGYSCIYNINMCRGSEFQVNTAATPSQIYPQAAKIDDHRYVVVWNSIGQELPEITKIGLFGKIFDSLGQPLSSEFHLNAFTSSDQRFPQIGVIDNTRFVVVWEDQSNDLGALRIKGRIFNSLGLPLFPEFTVSTYATPKFHFPQVEVIDNNNFVVVWGGDFMIPGAPARFHIFGRLFNRDGAPVNSTEFIINKYSQDIQILPKVKRIDSNRFVVVWNGPLNNIFSTVVEYYIYGRIYNKLGVNLTDEFYINTAANYPQAYPQVEVLDPTRFVVAWQSNTSSINIPKEIIFRLYNSAGIPITSPITANSYTADVQKFPVLNLNGTFYDNLYPRQIRKIDPARFALVWESRSQEGQNFYYGVYGKIYNFDGTPLSQDFLVNTSTTGDQMWPQITALTDSRFVVIWHYLPDYSNAMTYDGSDVYGTIFDSAGNKLSSEFKVNSTSDDARIWPVLEPIGPKSGDIATLRFVVLWHSGHIEWAGSAFDIDARIYYYH